MNIQMKLPPQFGHMYKTDIRDRLLCIIEHEKELHGYGYLGRLSHLSGITTWQNVYRRRQRPTQEQLQFIGRLYPHYAFWLITGLVNEEAGHTWPKAEDLTGTEANVRDQDKKRA